MKKFKKSMILLVLGLMSLNSAFADSSKDIRYTPTTCSMVLGLSGLLSSAVISDGVRGHLTNGVYPDEYAESRPWNRQYNYKYFRSEFAAGLYDKSQAYSKFGKKAVDATEKWYKGGFLRNTLIFTGVSSTAITACEAIAGNLNSGVNNERAKSFSEAPKNAHGVAAEKKNPQAGFDHQQ